ncbi:MAG: hypothetical protein C0612_11775, partial [Desulfobulbaceae bacterium]
GNEISKTRPVLVVSNNINNRYAGTVTVLPITSRKLNKMYPFDRNFPAPLYFQGENRIKSIE